MNEFLTVGKFGAPHGIRGWIRVQSYTEPYDNILGYPHWFVKQNKQWQLLPKTEVKTRGAHCIAKISGFDTPEQARVLTHSSIGIQSSALKPLPRGEYYWTQLIGLQVFNKKDFLLGTVDYLFATGANDVLVLVTPDKKECLVPYLDTVIQSIDCVQKRMIVDWEW